MKKISKFALFACSFTLSAVASYGAALASDNATNAAYSGATWTTATNGGTGFGAWSFTASGGGGHFIGGTGLGSTGFGVYSGGNGASDFSSADRQFTGALSVGQTFSIDLGNTTTIANGGDVGINLLDGSGVVFTLKFAGGASNWQLNDGGSDFSTSIGYAHDTPFHFTFTYEGGHSYDVSLNGYTGTGFTAGSTISNITGVRIFSSKQGGGENAGFNNLAIVPEPSSVTLLLGSSALGSLYLLRRRRA